MKTFSGIILAYIIIIEVLAFATFHYDKSIGWWAADLSLVCLNLLGFFIVENNEETPPPNWKVYIPVILMIALLILVVLPQASTFNK